MLAEDVSLSALTFATSMDSFNVLTSSLACRSASLIKKEKDGKLLSTLLVQFKKEKRLPNGRLFFISFPTFHHRIDDSIVTSIIQDII